MRSQQVRNTVLSASILGVLGLSAGLVFFSARRLRAIATQQVEFVAADSPGRAARGPVDLAEAARAAVKGMQGLAAERRAEIAVEIAEDLPRVNGDLSHLTRAISNLLGNALKYGGDAPRVTLRVSRVASGVEIAVSDQGAGLAQAEIPRLFEPFYRGQRASEAHVPGSGLGLALVKRIVESHGGRVSAGNDASGGALFTIGLPAA